MKIVCYAKSENQIAGRLEQIINAQARSYPKRICRSIEKLSRQLRQPFDSKIMGVFMAADYRDLKRLLSIRHLFRDIPIILIIPDLEEATLSMGHALEPRFLSCADESGLEDVAAVMKKMINNLTRPTG